MTGPGLRYSVPVQWKGRSALADRRHFRAILYEVQDRGCRIIPRSFGFVISLNEQAGPVRFHQLRKGTYGTCYYDASGAHRLGQTDTERLFPAL